MKINGFPVVDATKKLKIKITNRDISKAHSKDASACAAAKAVKRQCRVTDARVHIARTYLKINDKYVRYYTSPALRTEIIAFDKGGRFASGEYLLASIRPSHRQGVKQGNSAKKKTNKPTRKRSKPHIVSDVRHFGANR